MRVTPKSEQEAQKSRSQFTLLDKGEYDFEVLEAEDTESKSGNDMLALKLSILDNEDKVHIVFDYIVNNNTWAFKLRHFAASVGLLKQYESGDLPPDMMVNRAGRAAIDIQPAKNGYDAKNIVKDYIADVGSEQERAPLTGAPEKPRTVKEDLDDSIPF